MDRRVLDFGMNATMLGFNAAAIMMIGMGDPVWGGILGLLSEPGYAYFSWKSRSWGLMALTVWYTWWYGKMVLGG